MLLITEILSIYIKSDTASLNTKIFWFIFLSEWIYFSYSRFCCIMLCDLKILVHWIMQIFQVVPHFIIKCILKNTIVFIIEIVADFMVIERSFLNLYFGLKSYILLFATTTKNWVGFLKCHVHFSFQVCIGQIHMSKKP